MALKSVLKRGGASQAASAQAATVAAQAAPASGLGSLLKHGITLPADRAAQLREGMYKGVEFFDEYNNSRLELALASFEKEMLNGLFEIIYLLHVNAPPLANWAYQVQYKDGDKPKGKKNLEDTIDLYIEGAPHGVQGFDELPQIFREQFQKYTQTVFGAARIEASYNDYFPIISLHSIGSIGTVGHKSEGSDLDLQVIFSLEPFSYDTSDLSDDLFREAMKRESALWMRDFSAKKNIPVARLKDPRVLKELHSLSARELAKTYPNLHKYLIRRQGDYAVDFQGDSSQPLRIQCLHELINLMKRAPKLLKASEMETMNQKLRERIDRLQRYITLKFPSVEIYMFPMSIDDYRRGIYSSTLEFKESSGSAYELILNQDTLMPGIQFTNVVPSHYVFPEEVNNNPPLFNRLSDYIRFEAVEIYDSVKARLVNLGSTGNLSQQYIAEHSGAVYWEAFKASSGNLPKAFLNLLRYEMLLQKRYLKTVIQMVKDPRYLDPLITPKPESKSKRKSESLDPDTGIANWQILEMEEQFPKLRGDPWWLRYKALKIAFTEEKGVAGLDSAERKRVSKLLDLSFALHVRISDIFTKPGSRREFKLHREQVLDEYFKRAFPQNSPQRKKVEFIFIGDVHAVNEFEEELRDLFKRCLGRVRKKLAAFGLDDKQKGNEEFEIWYHYYQDNFDLKPNMVQRSIMNHLKVARGRLQVGYILGKGWFFKSLQRESGIGKRFDTFGFLDHLPDNVALQENTTFLAGLAHCIINGYYGVLNKGTLKERQTALEFDGKFLDHGHIAHNSLAFLRPDQVDRILQKIITHFPYQDYDYLDVIREERKMTEVLIFLNLWEFGRLSILSRDNLRTYYCDEYLHPDMLKNAKTLCKSIDKMLSLQSLHKSLGSFFDTRKVLMDEVSLAVWVNPNSVETTHGANQSEQKEQELAEAFEEAIHKVHDYN
ncbi:MAG: hypothetical protein IID61_01025 [SAR324 cluster bacterium]|nr:hypothetical protein [SAR324 cluster bacterium]